MEKFINCCLDSVLDENFQNVEVIFINDGSTDHTHRILSEYKKGYSNLIYINNAHYGVSVSRNLGLSIATGRYFMFLDADDYLNVNWKEILLPQLKENYDVVFLASAFVKGSNEQVNVLGANTTIIDEKRMDYIAATSLYYDEEYGNKDNPYFGLGACTAAGRAYKKQIQEINNIWFRENVSIFEDGIFNMQMLRLCKNGCHIKENIYCYRINPNSTTRKIDSELQSKFRNRNNEVLNILADEIGNTEYVQRYIC